MAEAHNVAALSFSLTHDGVSVSYDQELLRDIWHAFTRSYKRRTARWKNDFSAGIYPASSYSLLCVTVAIIALQVIGFDATFGLNNLFQNYAFYYLFGLGLFTSTIGMLWSSMLVWFLLIQVMRLTLKAFLSYKGWMYEDTTKGLANVSIWTKMWLKVLHIMSRSEPLMHSFQGALPHLPLPSLQQTLQKNLESRRPISTDKEYEELVALTEQFSNTIGPRLQRYLWIKSWLSVNYVTDWWEEFVYLRQRTPIMVNSNYYCLDSFKHLASHKQAARAANVAHAALQFRQQILRSEVSPFSISPRYKVPFCTMQYERAFHTTRIPGEETDSLLTTAATKHIAVLHNGRWFNLKFHTGKRMVTAAELQKSMEAILADTTPSSEGERELAALTAGERTHWARTRKDFFSRGVNKTSLHCIERAAFVMILTDSEVNCDDNDPSKLDAWACEALHGNGMDRWYDKSLNIIISKNAKTYFNLEHSWGDAAVSSHFLETMMYTDVRVMGYDENGDCKGTVVDVPTPHKLQWSLNDECRLAIDKSLSVARELIADVEMSLLPWREYGKGFMKRCKVSPDAFLQMTLQLAYRKNQHRSCLTYEASMTRLFREGRTETVRSCTNDSKAFVDSMLDVSADMETRRALLHTACESHQTLYRDAMCGAGIDRHLFALYVVSRYLEETSPFLDAVMPPVYELSTSQTPLQQTPGVNLAKDSSMATIGGGFGPVSATGYGVSYIVVGEDLIGFHISSKKSAENTSSPGFREDVIAALRQMRALYPDVEAIKAYESPKHTAALKPVATVGSL